LNQKKNLNGILGNLMNTKERLKSAYHEAGHIIVAYLLVPNKEISKATITHHGDMRSNTWITDKERISTRDKFLLLGEIKIALAGYTAERMRFGIASNNVDDEFELATSLAHNMAWRWGMGKSGYVGNFELKGDRWISHIIHEELDKDTQDILEGSLSEVKELLRCNWNIVEKLAQELNEKGELKLSDIEKIFTEADKKRPTEEEVFSEKEESHRTGIGWDDVVGMDAVKQEAKEMVQLIKDRVTLQKIGGKILKGLLMIGPPGCGKTYLARAMANEANLPFIARAGSEFSEMYVGVGASRIRRLFLEAKELAQAKGGCIIFIDEIDALGGRRKAEAGGGAQTEYNQTLNQLLVEMDGLREKDVDSNVIVIGATNMPIEYLDPALVRAGRFDRTIFIELPDLEDRAKIIEYYLKKIKHDPDDVKIDKLARLTVISSPADIHNIIKEATLITIRNKKETVTMKEINEARERIALGLKRRFKYTPQEKMRTAYHEAGHIMVTYLLVPTKDVFKASIIPRGHAGGVTWIPEKEQIMCRDQEMLLGEIKISLAGYSAEKIKFGTPSTGVSGDFKSATVIAHSMSWEYGMGKSGYIGDYTSEMFRNTTPLGYDITKDLNKDAQEILKSCLSEVENLLRKNWEVLEKLANSLLAKEELDYDEIDAIFKEYNLSRPNN